MKTKTTLPLSILNTGLCAAVMVTVWWQPAFMVKEEHASEEVMQKMFGNLNQITRLEQNKKTGQVRQHRWEGSRAGLTTRHRWRTSKSKLEDADNRINIWGHQALDGPTTGDRWQVSRSAGFAETATGDRPAGHSLTHLLQGVCSKRSWESTV